ncbi:MAG: type II toxin-antitoxin system prevent-host-death family antitoxin [Rhodoferax sp.]
MKSFAVFEAKNRFSELLNAVENGEEITITRHGQPVARLVSVNVVGQSPTGQRVHVAGVLQRLHLLGRDAGLGVSLAQAIESGRD